MAFLVDDLRQSHFRTYVSLPEGIMHSYGTSQISIGFNM